MNPAASENPAISTAENTHPAGAPGGGAGGSMPLLPGVRFNPATANRRIKEAANRKRLLLFGLALILGALMLIDRLEPSIHAPGGLYGMFDALLTVASYGVIALAVASPLLPDSNFVKPSVVGRPVVQCRHCHGVGWPDDLVRAEPANGKLPHADRTCPRCGHDRFDVTKMRRYRVTGQVTDVPGRRVDLIA